jgi:hypothetical protein
VHRGQLVGAQRGAAGHQIADQVGGAQARGDFHRTGQLDHLCVHALLGQPLLEDGRVAGGDAGAGQLRRTLPLPFLRHRQHQPALAEAQPAQRLVGVRQADLAACRGLFVQLVATDDAEVADAVGDQAEDVVVAHQQQVHRQRFAVAEQLVAARASSGRRR